MAKARARVWLTVAAVVVGILLARELAPSPLPTLFAGLALMAACTLCVHHLRRAPRRAGLVRACAWLLAWLTLTAILAATTSARFWRTPRDSLLTLAASVAPGDTPILTLDGIVRTPPTPLRAPDPTSLARFQPFEPTWWCELDVRSVVPESTTTPPRRATGRITLMVKGDLPTTPPTPGDALRVTGQYSPPRVPLNPAAHDDLLDALATNHAGLLALSSAELAHPAPTLTPTTLDHLRGLWARSLASLRARTLAVLTSATKDATPDTRALLLALILGQQPDDAPANADAATQATFARLGLVHALSISGFHLSVMALVALWAVRLSGDRGWLEPVLVALLVLVYVALVPASPPLTRSALMVLALLASHALGRRWDALCVLGLVAIALLIAHPLDLWSLGFQLSLGLTAVLLWSVPHTAHTLFSTPIQGLVDRRPRLLRRLLESVQLLLAASIACWLVALPIVMHSVGMVSPWGILASVLLAPLIVLVLWVGYIALLLGVLMPFVAALAGGLLVLLASTVLALAAKLDALPLHGVRVPPISLLWTILATLVLLLATRRATRRTAWRWLLACALLTLWLPLEWSRTLRLPAGTTFRVDMLAASDGSCFFLRDRTGKTLLWDAKPPPGFARSSLPAIAANARALGVARVETAILTHPDLDHVAGILDVVEPLGIREVCVPARFLTQAHDNPTGVAATIATNLRARGVTIRTLASGDTITLGDASATILSPPKDSAAPADNDHALVALWQAPTRTAGPMHVLMTGDIGPTAIAPLAQQQLPPIAVMELPHHGAPIEPAIAWVRTLAPRVALQSTGPRRAQRPGWEVLTTTDRRISAFAGWTRVDILDTGELAVRSMRE